jgi:hypothetical protein
MRSRSSSRSPSWPAIRLDFEPRGKLISSTSKFVKDFYDPLLVDPDTTSRIVLTAHELLENTAKYASDGVTRMQVALAEREGQIYVQIETRNRAVPHRLVELLTFLDEIRDADDPLALYYRFIARSATRSEGSGLGLARIRAEGEMSLAYAVDGDEVTIVAETPVELRGDL